MAGLEWSVMIKALREAAAKVPVPKKKKKKDKMAAGRGSGGGGSQRRPPFITVLQEISGPAPCSVSGKLRITADVAPPPPLADLDQTEEQERAIAPDLPARRLLFVSVTLEGLISFFLSFLFSC